MPSLYRVPGPVAPISQGDIFRAIPNPKVPFDHHLVESNGTYRLEMVEGKLHDEMEYLAVAEFVTAIVLTQSCDAARAESILLAPVSPLAIKANKPDKQWSEIQTLATSLHQPTRVYLPDDPFLGLDRSLVELSEAFSLSRSDLEAFALAERRVATLNDEGASYLSYRLAMMFWRVGRDDYAWPSKADLLCKKAYLEASIEKSQAKVQALLKEQGDEAEFNLEAVGAALRDYMTELARTEQAIATWE